MISLVVAALAVASCDYFTADRRLFQIPVRNGDSVFGPSDALYAVRELFAENRCPTPREFERPLCHTFVENDEQTTSCYVAVPAVGYFFVTKDYMDTYNIVFSRWD